MKEFNINSFVNVKLTDFGIDILNQYNESLAQIHPKARKLEIQVDENGYTSFQLAELMQIFGQYLFESSTAPIPFEPTIIISEQELKEPSFEKGKSL